MSLRAAGWAMNAPAATPVQRLVLIALADHATDDGVCLAHPKIEALADWARCSTIEIVAALGQLHEAGVLTFHHDRYRLEVTR